MTVEGKVTWLAKRGLQSKIGMRKGKGEKVVTPDAANKPASGQTGCIASGLFYTWYVGWTTVVTVRRTVGTAMVFLESKATTRLWLDFHKLSRSVQT